MNVVALHDVFQKPRKIQWFNQLSQKMESKVNVVALHDVFNNPHKIQWFKICANFHKISRKHLVFKKAQKYSGSLHVIVHE